MAEEGEVDVQGAMRKNVPEGRVRESVIALQDIKDAGLPKLLEAMAKGEGGPNEFMEKLLDGMLRAEDVENHDRTAKIYAAYMALIHFGPGWKDDPALMKVMETVVDLGERTFKDAFIAGCIYSRALRLDDDA